MPNSSSTFEYQGREEFGSKGFRRSRVYGLLFILLGLAAVLVWPGFGSKVNILAIVVLAAVLGLVCVFALRVLPPAVLVHYELRQGNLLISRRYERGPAKPKQEEYDLRNLVAIRVIREQEKPDSNDTVLRIPRSLGLLLQGSREPVSRFVNISIDPIKVSASTEKKARYDLAHWRKLCEGLESAAQSALASRWSRLHDYGRYCLIVQLAEFSILRGAPSSWRMLRASFQGIWDAIRRCREAILHGLIPWYWFLFGLLCFLALAYGISKASGNGQWYDQLKQWFDQLEQSFDKLPSGLQFVLLFGTFFFGAATAIVQWFRPLSLDEQTEEESLATLLVGIGSKGEFDAILKLADDRLDRIKSVLDRATLITATAGLLPTLLSKHHSLANYVTLGAGAIVIVTQLYRFAQTRMLRVAKTACLIAQNALATQA